MINVFNNSEKQAWFEETANIIHSIYGDSNQRNKLAEECAEYAAARMKYLTEKSEQNKSHCIEEMADVILVLQQNLAAMPEDEISILCANIEAKAKRELNRISQKQHDKRIANTFTPNQDEMSILKACKDGNMSHNDLADILDTNPKRVGKIALRLERAGLLKPDYDLRAVLSAGNTHICKIKVYETTTIGKMVMERVKCATK